MVSTNVTQPLFPSSRIIRGHWTIGRFSLMVTTENVGSQFGKLGSRGWTWHLSFWINPK